MTRMYPGHPIVGVGALVIRGHEVLLVKRCGEPGRGLWSIPGGLPRAGEPLVDAVRRELREETGLDGRVIGVVWVDEVIVEDTRGIRYHYVILDFLIEYAGGEPRAGSDACEAAWMSAEEAAERRDVTPTTRRLLRSLIRFKYRPPILAVGAPSPCIMRDKEG